MKNNIRIEGRDVGAGEPCFIIGEIGSNHCHDKNIVKELIDAAATAKLDAVKFQIYDPKEAFSANEQTSDVGLEHLYGRRPWWEVARDHILMPRDWFGEMFEYAREKGLIPFSTIHRKEDLEFLMPFDPPVIKIASIDLHFHHLINDLLTFEMPFLVSTGMAYLSEIDETVRLFEMAERRDLVLMHCVSCYPPKPEEMNIRNITALQNAFDVPIGYSDHSDKNFSAFAAVTLGAVVIEKHITLDRMAFGPDHPFALEPDGMVDLSTGIREIEASLGRRARRVNGDENKARLMIRRSLVTRVPLKKGEAISLEKIKFARPGTGITTNEFKYVSGRTVNRDIPSETVLQFEMLNN
jgi:N,N'-diacetyllegionaminate synthase